MLLSIVVVVVKVDLNYEDDHKCEDNFEHENNANMNLSSYKKTTSNMRMPSNMKTTSKETKPNQNYKTNTSKPTKPKISNQNYQNRQGQVCLELGTAQPQLVFSHNQKTYCKAVGFY